VKLIVPALYQPAAATQVPARLPVVRELELSATKSVSLDPFAAPILILDAILLRSVFLFESLAEAD
jgi:hypothetical protein